MEANREEYRPRIQLPVADRGGYAAPVFANDRIIVRNTSVIACATIGDASGPSTTAATTRNETEGEFSRFLDRAASADDPQTLVDQWWNSQQQFPIVESDRQVHFVYRGNADDVGLLGDMAEDRHIPDAMKQVAGTDLFYASYDYLPNGLWHYAFLVDFDRVELDPRNAKSALALIDVGGNPRMTSYENHKKESVLEMPGWRKPTFLTRVPTRRGRLDAISFESEERLRTNELNVYLPADYDTSQKDYPTIFILGGDEWLEQGDIAQAFDNLMGESCEPAIVVFVPFHEGSADRIGGADYAALVRRDIVPVIDEQFRTRLPRVAVGAAVDATPAILLAANSPQEFSRVVIQSPFMDEGDFQTMEAAAGYPEYCYLDWSQFEPRMGDTNIDYVESAKTLKSILQAAGCELQADEVIAGPGWKSWVTRIDKALSFVLPPGK